jgi:3-oxoacyl-[acyl-carrier-protein] synthase II
MVAQRCGQEIDYINAHGTSTRLNDLMEGNAVKQVFGEEAARGPIVDQIHDRHPIGAAGAVETGALVLTLQHGVLPTTIDQR